MTEHVRFLRGSVQVDYAHALGPTAEEKHSRTSEPITDKVFVHDTFFKIISFAQQGHVVRWGHIV